MLVSECSNGLDVLCSSVESVGRVWPVSNTPCVSWQSLPGHLGQTSASSLSMDNIQSDPSSLVTDWCLCLVFTEIQTMLASRSLQYVSLHHYYLDLDSKFRDSSLFLFPDFCLN